MPRISMRSANARYSADPDGVGAQVGLIGVPWLMIGEETIHAERRIGYRCQAGR
jgi:hypothetical protein